MMVTWSMRASGSPLKQTMNLRFLVVCLFSIGFVRSSDRVGLYGWHRVLVSRRGKETSIRLDDGATHQGRSLGPLSELNLNTALFVGGLRPHLALPRDVPRLANLHGAVQRVIVNGEVFDKLMDDPDQQVNVAVYRGPPCGHMPVTHRASSREAPSTPCLNAGICQPLLANFVCKCQSGFLGKRCEKREAASFFFFFFFFFFVSCCRFRFSSFRVFRQSKGIDNADEPRSVRFDGKTFLKYPNQLKDV